MVFLFAPAGLLLGLIIGAVAARMSAGTGAAHFFTTQDLALLYTGVAVGGAGGLALLAADRHAGLRPRDPGFSVRDRPGRSQVRRAQLLSYVVGAFRRRGFAGVRDPAGPGPTEADTAWTDWQKSRDPLGKYEVRTGEPYQVRFRVAPVPPTA